MATLTLQQVAAYARGAGFSGDDLVNMVAVATPESSLRTDAVNSASGAVGLWQINQPVHVRDHPTWTRAWLTDPQNNASAAKTIHSQQGMGAWEAWTSGAAQPYMAAARDAVASVGGGTHPGTAPAADPAAPGSVDPVAAPDLLGGLKDSLGGLTAIAKLGISVAAWMANPGNWNRLLWVILGGGMVLIGLEKTGVPVASTIGKVRGKVDGWRTPTPV
jgi:hypothetical protein